METEPAMPTSKLFNTMVIVLFVVLVAFTVRAEEGSTYYDLGVFSFESGEYETAEQQLKKALELSPDNPLYHHYLGKIYLKMERYDDAMTYLAQAWSDDPELDGLKYDLAYGYFQLKDHTKAAELFAQVAEEEPTHVLAHYYGGVSLYHEEQYEKALDYFFKASKMSPTININGRYYAGLCYVKIGDDEKAVKELEYVRDNADSATLKENSIKWLESIKNREKALKPYVIYAKLGYRYDDNVTFEPLNEDLFTNDDDFLTSIDFAGQYHFVNKPDWKLTAGYYHYQTIHNQLDEYDLVESAPNLNVRYQWDPLIFGLSYLYEYYWLDYERYLRRHHLIPNIIWNVNKQFSTRIKYKYYDNEHFQENKYDGDNHEISLGFDYTHLIYEKEIILVGEIGYEDNNATGLEEYYERIKVRGGIYFMGPWQLRFRLTARYEDKEYDSRVTTDDNNTIREDNKFIGSFLMSHRFYYDFLNIQAEYEYIKNDSNDSFYDYEKNSIGLFFTFTY